MSEYFHSVYLIDDECKGCTHCIRRCPTEAIRVRDGKAEIAAEKCVDCGECVRICANKAKTVKTDELSELKKYKYKIAIPAPSFLMQLPRKLSAAKFLSGLITIGFDEVYEVAQAAEEVTRAIQTYIKENNKIKPLISSACPAVVRLIQVKFPSLTPYIIPVQPPVDIAAMRAREAAAKKTNLNEKDIGVFFITPCPAKMTAIRQPVGKDESYVSGAIAMKDAYDAVLKDLKSIREVKNIQKASSVGAVWGIADGEYEHIDTDKKISVDGIHNVIKVLEKAEDGILKDIDYIEAQACPGGCVGGVLAVENPHIAKMKFLNLNRSFPKSSMDEKKVEADYKKGFYLLKNEIKPRPIYKLSENYDEALKLMGEVEKIMEKLPQIDCGSCGCPTCRAFAEDIVLGKADISECFLVLRKNISELSQKMVKLSKNLPRTVAKLKN